MKARLKAHRQKFHDLPHALQGAFWMIIAAVMLGNISVLVRFVSADMHPFQIAFFRNLGQFMMMAPWVLIVGIHVMKTERFGAHLRRSLFGLAAMLTWFTALSMLPVAKATALSFTAPLFATLGAAVILREVVRVRRWTATIIGFIGAVIILRPGLHVMSGAEWTAIAAALIAGAMLSNKSLARTENPTAMVMWMGLIMTILSLPPALMVWQWPADLAIWGWLAVLGVVATAAHLALNRAFRVADASYVMPFGFVQLPAVAAMAYVFFGETSDALTWVGAAVIFSAGAYIARRESMVTTESVVVQPQPAVQVVEPHREDDDDDEEGA